MIGERLGPYLIESELGSGGMGSVYAARVERAAAGLDVGDRVAVKVLHAHLVAADGFFKRFLREAQIGRSVRHVNVVRTVEADSTTHEGSPVYFLVMELVHGQTLRGLLRELSPVPEELCRRIALQMVGGLQAIHEVGALHRDIKPENVLITPDHEVKLMDLGVARLVDESVRLSRTGAFVGSLQYAAPEVFRDALGPIDQRADLHALGLVLHELCTGDAPYAAQEMSECIRRVLEVTPRRVGDLNPQVSPFFEELIASLLSKRPEGRPASAQDLLQILVDGERGPWWRDRANAIRADTRRPLRRVRIPRETAVYGRDEELEQLIGVFDQVKRGRGRVVLVEGEAGIGKSRLIDELVRRLLDASEDLDFLFGSYPPGGAATASGAFSTAYREHLGVEDLEAVLEVALGTGSALVPSFAALLRGDPPPIDAERLSAGAMATMFLRVTRHLAAERPVVVLIDDLHHAPDEALALFSALAHGLKDDRVLLIGTTRRVRDDDRLASVAQLGDVERVRLSRLGPRDLAALVRDVLKSRILAGELGLQIAERTDGNPFFLFAFLDELRRRRRLVQSGDGSWSSPETLEGIEVPESVRDLVRSRVAQLSDEERDFIEVAACCGFRFDPTLVAEAVGMPILPALKLCARVELRHALVRAVGREYEFDHHQIQEVLYAGIFETLREQYHGALGEALHARLADREASPGESHAVCDHFLHAGDGARAAPYLASAVAHLRRANLTCDVLDMTTRALALDGGASSSSRVTNLLMKASAEHTLARPSEAETLAEALALAEADGNVPQLVDALAALGNLQYVSGDNDSAIKNLTRAMELATDDDLPAINARRSMGNLCSRMGRFDDALTHFERAIAIAQARGDEAFEAADTINRGIALERLGRRDDARRSYARGLELARRTGHRKWEANALGNLGGIVYADGRLAEALEHAERFRLLTHEGGNRRSELAAACMLAATLVACGALDEASRELVSAKRLAREVRTLYFEAFALATLAELAAHRGDFATAEQENRPAIEIRARVGMPSHAVYTQLELALYRAEQGDLEECAAIIDDALERASELDDEILRAESLLLRADLVDSAATDDALSAYASVAEKLDGDRAIRCAYRAWKLGGDDVALQRAADLVRYRRDHAPPEHRERMLTEHMWHRRVMQAVTARDAAAPTTSPPRPE